MPTNEFNSLTVLCWKINPALFPPSDNVAVSPSEYMDRKNKQSEKYGLGPSKSNVETPSAHSTTNPDACRPHSNNTVAVRVVLRSTRFGCRLSIVGARRTWHARESTRSYVKTVHKRTCVRENASTTGTSGAGAGAGARETYTDGTMFSVEIKHRGSSSTASLSKNSAVRLWVEQLYVVQDKCGVLRRKCARKQCNVSQRQRRRRRRRFAPV